MFSLFRAAVDRVKAVLATAAAQEVEAEFLARDAERRAELLRLAARYEAEGLPTVAARLRDRTEAADADRPAGSVLPAVAHWQGEPPPAAASPTSALPVTTTGDRRPAIPNGRKKAR